MVADEVLKQLQSSEDKVKILVIWYNHLFSTAGKVNLFPIFHRLIKLYGETGVFFSILDCYDVEKFDATNPYGLMAYFCKKRLERSLNPVATKSLESFRDEIEKQMKKKPPKIEEMSFDG